MQLISVLPYLLLALPATVGAVFKDEVDHIDYHKPLLGLPNRETTFFHRPRKTEKASLLYTLTDVGVVGALNPGTGDIVWRQQIALSTSAAQSHLRAGEGESWICSAHGKVVQAWEAIGGRNVWSIEFAGDIRDLEIMELTAGKSKDVLVLLEETESTLVRRLSGEDGHVVWEYSETVGDVPLQVSTSVEKVFVVSLTGTQGAYGLRITVLDTATGMKVDDITIASKGSIESENQILFVGANSAAPIIAWIDVVHSLLKLNILGTKIKHDLPIADEVVAVEIHAPHLVQSQPHFLVHTKTKTENKADVYHVDLTTNEIKHAYELPRLSGKGAFSTSSIGTNVYFTRITEDQVIVTSSVSHGVLARWDLKTSPEHVGPIRAVHAVSEVVKKVEDNYAVRSAAVTTTDDWVLVRNGEQAWTRPEGMSGGIAAIFASIPESTTLAHNLELEAHSNPAQAFIHRLTRHIKDLEGLPDYLASIPERLVGSILGSESRITESFQGNFGFSKLIILATKRGKVYCMDTGKNGKVLWHMRAYDIPKEDSWSVKGMFIEEDKQQVTIRGSNGEQLVVRLTDGFLLEASPRGTVPLVQSTAIVNTEQGKWMIPIGIGGEIAPITAEWQPKDRLVVSGSSGEIKGLLFDGRSTNAIETWSFLVPGQKILHIATRASDEPIASIGRVLGDRSVLYKYLNPNTIVVAVGDENSSSLTVYLLDTVSGQVLSSSTYSGVDLGKPVECAISENWFFCTFFGQFVLRESGSQSIKGWQAVINDMYESDLPNSRGPLGSNANYSSLGPIDSPTSPPLPHIISQAYILGAPLSALAVTQTRQGITSRALLAYIGNMHSIIALPRPILEPRRPIGREPNAMEKDEGLTKYSPAIEMDPRLIITHERDVLGVRKIIAAPALVESTSIVFAYGVDVFGTRVTPSMSFDILGKGFDKLTLIITVLALFLGVLLIGPMVSYNLAAQPF